MLLSWLYLVLLFSLSVESILYRLKQVFLNSSLMTSCWDWPQSHLMYTFRNHTSFASLFVKLLIPILVEFVIVFRSVLRSIRVSCLPDPQNHELRSCLCTTIVLFHSRNRIWYFKLVFPFSRCSWLISPTLGVVVYYSAFMTYEICIMTFNCLKNFHFCLWIKKIG